MKNAALISFFLLSGSLLSGCESDKRLPPEYSYQIRGIIVSSAVDQQGHKEIKLRHEAIPAFFDAEGKSEPMHSMTMAFPVDDQIAIDSLQKGDEIEATYEVRWKSSPRETISRIVKLPTGSVNLKKPAP